MVSFVYYAFSIESAFILKASSKLVIKQISKPSAYGGFMDTKLMARMARTADFKISAIFFRVLLLQCVGQLLVNTQKTSTAFGLNLYLGAG